MSQIMDGVSTYFLKKIESLRRIVTGKKEMIHPLNEWTPRRRDVDYTNLIIIIIGVLVTLATIVFLIKRI